MYATVLLLLSCVIIHRVCAQANVSSMGLAYSALIRDNTGKPQPLTTVQLRFTLLNGINGDPLRTPWVETQTTQTDAYGYANVTIGMGTQTGGTAASFAAVDFSTTGYWLLSEITTGGAYTPLEKKALQAVPYAKYAGSVASPFTTGTMVAFGGDINNIPQGWLLCDGTELDNTNPLYLPLFKVIGYNWGSSNHSNKFNVPNTAGMFLRGANNGLKNDPDANARIPFTGGIAGDKVGSKQMDAFQSHEHNYNGYIFHANNPNNVAGFVTQFTNGQTYLAQPLIAGPNIYADPNYCSCPTSQQLAKPQTSSETRPANISVNYIIKL